MNEKIYRVQMNSKGMPNFSTAEEIEGIPIYGNEHNCIMTIFGECSYAETGCGDCAAVEKVRKALSADRPTRVYEYLRERIGDIVDSEAEFEAWFERMVWHVEECNRLADRPQGDVDAVAIFEHEMHNLEQGYITIGEFDERIEPLHHLCYGRPKGKWTSAGLLTVCCSNCGEQFHGLEAMNFCPNCGADMRGEDE